MPAWNLQTRTIAGASNALSVSFNSQTGAVKYQIQAHIPGQGWVDHHQSPLTPIAGALQQHTLIGFGEPPNSAPAGVEVSVQARALDAAGKPLTAAYSNSDSSYTDKNGTPLPMPGTPTPPIVIPPPVIPPVATGKTLIEEFKLALAGSSDGPWYCVADMVVGDQQLGEFTDSDDSRLSVSAKNAGADFVELYNVAVSLVANMKALEAVLLKLQAPPPVPPAP